MENSAPSKYKKKFSKCFTCSQTPLEERNVTMPFRSGSTKQGKPCTKSNLVGAPRQGNVGGLGHMIVVRFNSPSC
jgi:hypothetical protein